MAKKIAKKKASGPKQVKRTKTTRHAKAAKPTLVWKRSRRGRPKKTETKKKQASTTKTAGRQDERINANGGELQVEQSKFQLGPRQNAGEFQAHNLPFEYGQNRIILLTIDPKFAFVYWEVRPEKMQEALSSIGQNSKLALRFCNITNNHTWDISIYERVGNWYLKLDHPEQHLIVEIGMKNDRGDFYSIASSNTMRFPRIGLAGRGPVKWMLVSPSGEKVVTEIEDYTDADLELLKKILGPYFYDLFRRGKFSTVTGSSAENIFMNVEDVQLPGISS